MSEYLIRGDTLTGIADAIREKVGSSDGIDPAQMAELIKGIQSGGGSESVFGQTAASGSFTLSADAASFTIEHGLGRAPQGGIVFLGAQSVYQRSSCPLLVCAAAYSSPNGDRQMVCYGHENNSNQSYYYVSSESIESSSSEADQLSYYKTPLFDANESSISVGDSYGGKARYLMNSRPYYWIVW